MASKPATNSKRGWGVKWPRPAPGGEPAWPVRWANLSASIKAVADARRGHTITCLANPPPKRCPAMAEAKPMVFSAGCSPTDADQYPDLPRSTNKLQLSDAALKFEPRNHSAMGLRLPLRLPWAAAHESCRSGLEREYNLDLIVDGAIGDYQ